MCFLYGKWLLFRVETGLQFAPDPMQHIRVFEVSEAQHIYTQRPCVPNRDARSRRWNPLRRGEDDILTRAADGIHYINPAGACTRQDKDRP